MRRLILTMGLAICTCLAGASNIAALAQTTEQIAKGNCDVTANTCQTTLSYCVKQKGRHAEQTVTNALKDCITACQTTEEFLSRGSRFQNKAAAMAIEACMLVAKVCDGFPSDKEMKATADECRKTASNLQKIASAAGPS